LEKALKGLGFEVAVERDLGALAFDKAWRGDFAGAGLLVAESDSVAAATGSQVPPFAALRLRSLQGREAEASALIETTIEQADAGGQSESAKMFTKLGISSRRQLRAALPEGGRPLARA